MDYEVCLCEGTVCWMSLCLFHFSMNMILILSQSSSLICDPVAAVLKCATCTHTAPSLENCGEVTITVPLCLPESCSVGMDLLFHSHC